MSEPDWHTEPLKALKLSVRVLNCLESEGIRTVGQLCETPFLEMLDTRSWGETTLNEAVAKLAVFGLRLLDYPPSPEDAA